MHEIRIVWEAGGKLLCPEEVRAFVGEKGQVVEADEAHPNRQKQNAQAGDPELRAECTMRGWTYSHNGIMA